MPAMGNHTTLPVDGIRLDQDNPRIKRFLAMYGENPTPEQIHLALGAGGDDPTSRDAGTTFSSLKESIRANGGIIHPIIVNKDDTGELVVIEGNTRVAIYRDFLESKVAGDWENIPAIVYTDLGKEAQDAIRLQSHLVGPRPWDPYSKAKYLHNLHMLEDMPFDRLVDYCGGRRMEVEHYIAAYLDMERHYRPLLDSDTDFDATRFSGFVELQKRNIKEAILGAGFSLDDFAKWIDERLIDPLQTVRRLPKILALEEARKVFLSEGAREAEKLIDRPSIDANLGDATLEQLCAVTIQRIKTLQFDDVRRLGDDIDGDTTQVILRLRDEVMDLARHIESMGD